VPKFRLCTRESSYLPRYSLRTNAVSDRQISGKRYDVYNINKFDNYSTVQHWYESSISEELKSNVLLLLEIIFFRDGSFFVSNDDAPFCSRHDLVSFIFFNLHCMIVCA